MSQLVINDENYHLFLPDGKIIHGGEPRLAGIIPRDWTKNPYGSLDFGQTYEAAGIENYPMEAWPDLIADNDRNKAWADDVWAASPIGVLDQDGLSYCHAFSACDAVMIERELMGLPYVELSAGSIGGPVTGYRNAGAYIIDDLRQVVEKGVASTEFVPMMQVSRSGWKPGAVENALLHTAKNVIEMQSRNFQQFGSVLISGRTVCIGLNWWGHAITGIRLRDNKNGRAATDHLRYDAKILNSWNKSWGENGCGWLSGSKKIPDEQYSFREIRNSKK